MANDYWLPLEDPPRDERAERIGPPDVAVPADEPRRYDRRGFFRVMGLSTAAVAAACKRAPVTKLLPPARAEEGVTPGRADWYATTCAGCSASCGLLVKSRDGRPIKIEGNPEHPESRGGVCAVGQAWVLSVYDNGRARRPRVRGRAASWEALDAEVRAGLARAKAAGKEIRVVTPSVLGPTARAALARFLAAHPGAKRVVFDAVSEDAIVLAHRATHGRAAIPSYHFDRASCVVSFGADFLGTWLSPVTFTRAWAAARDPARPEMLRHYQLEGRLSLTGSNADERIRLAPSEELSALGGLVRRLSDRASYPGKGTLHAALLWPRSGHLPAEVLDRLAGELWGARGRALVLSGSDDVRAQALVNAANELLGAYGTTVDLEAPLFDAPEAMTFAELVAELEKDRVGVAIFWDANPLYAHPRAAAIEKHLARVDLTVAIAARADETASRAAVLAPRHHALESWDDAEPRQGVVGLSQPLLPPLFATRAAGESLLSWAEERTRYLDFLRRRWEKEVYPAAAKRPAVFQAFWDRSIHDGFAAITPRQGAAAFDAAATATLLSPAGEGRLQPQPGLELVLHASVALRDGALANNGWLQEVPDPVSKVTWGNYAALSPARARALSVRDGDVVTIAAGADTIELPVCVQPGTHDGVVAVAVGYGRTRAGRIGDRVGANAWPLAALEGGRVRMTRAGVTLRPTGRRDPLAKSQIEDRLHHRPLIHETTAEEYRRNPKAGGSEKHAPSPRLGLWPEHEYNGHRWGMAIDLTACTGCTACIVSCQAENNIAMVGKDEVRRRREMHWLRIDRYYQGPEESPRVVHQPLPCLHCENAPCETVCPVLATVHSSEGLNQQVYARCVGTRYCANNCPAKMRRFNWFEYDRSDALANMVLNPDVTVRVRGVMEKCSLCVQRIQEGKALAKEEGRPVRDGDIQPACAQSCPAGAIVFGDLNDPASRLAALVESGRTYTILEDLNIRPRVRHVTKVRNPGPRSAG
jgi:molybdopterin-containing oxidoreductase family iron-sulfur binding subunit